MLIIIYKIINLKNGKAYIGQTVDLKRRLKEHRSGRGSEVLKRAIAKHGWDSFEVTELARCASYETAGRLEEHFIVVHSTNKPNGYNIGLGGIHARVSEESRAKMSRARKGKPHWWGTGTPWSEERRRNFMRALQERGGGHFKGKRHSEKTKLKISQNSRSGGVRYLKKPFDELSPRQRRRLRAKSLCSKE
jgi:group I intron endonuclease